MTSSELTASPHAGPYGAAVAPDLTSAVINAVQAGADELERLDGIAAHAETRLRGAWQILSSGRNAEAKGDDRFFALLDSVVSDLTSRLSESRRVASTFNIVFFGRTGAGKSTLLSALGGLNGELVSNGVSDFTTEVRALDWQSCRLYDTPGINGWGRTRSRPDLERTAREAIQVADVVLLCFDSQGPQASEFGKVAEWVLAYGKPAVAVLNMRNPMWRHFVRASSAQRKGLSQTARQHADTIGSELEAIGLYGVPVVAVHSKRALFARASVPFLAPAAVELEKERSAHGVDRLDRWSNLPLLEELIAACIREGAGDLRLAALREGFQARLIELADELELVAEEQQQRGVVVERAIAAWLNVLGYPEPPAEGSDLLRELESARGEPFTAPVSGRLEGHVRHLLRSHLYPHRTKSLRAAENLILDAFADQRVVTEEELEDHVFDSTALDKSLVKVAKKAGEFLSNNLGLARIDARVDLDLIDRSPFTIRGNAARGQRWSANVLRALGMFGGAASATLGILAVTNIWNPVGWVAAVVLVGTGAVSALVNFFGRRTRKGAESRRVTARAFAVAGARSTVNAFYDMCEARQLEVILARSRESAAALLNESLTDALHTRMGCTMLKAESVWMRGQAQNQPQTASASEVIRRAGARVLSQVDGWDPPSLEALLLGEDWIIDEMQEASPARISQLDHRRYTEATEQGQSGLSEFLHLDRASGDPGLIRRWLEGASAAASISPQERAELDAARLLLDTPPNVVVLGDYSSGKTSLIKRLLADAGTETPAALGVAAGSATSEASRYPFGAVVLVDVPGFQSGRSDHDAVAADATRDAALVIVVLHVNLLIGDTTRLERLLLGDESRVGLAPHTIYVIGRIDEIGVDPQLSARDFLARRGRKVDELLSILRSRGLDVRAGRVLPVAADPYGLVSDRTPVGREDYDSVNRLWDGIAALSEPLLALEHKSAVGLAASAALDRGRSALRSAHCRLQAEVIDLELALTISARLEQVLETSLAELKLLTQSVERRIRRVVDDHANEMLAEALGAGPAEVNAMSKRLKTWWEDPRLDSAMQSLQTAVDRDIADWWKRHSSELERELRRFEFVMKQQDLPDSGEGVADVLGAGIGMAAGVIKGAHGVGKAIGNRDAVYAIGKALRFKFKPWGAVKLGAKVGKAAAVLGVVAVAFDIADFVNDQVQQEKREQARKAAGEHIRSTADVVVADLLAQDGGPMEYLRQSEREFVAQLKQLQRESAVQRDTVLGTLRDLDEVEAIQVGGEELADVRIERVMR